jgi:putative flavoprotein involved in K+ transport
VSRDALQQTKHNNHPMNERHDVVVIGGGQAGLAMSYCLRQHGREHIVLERTRIAERWHSERWNSLAFQFPNWALKLPGWEYRGSEPDAFVNYREIARCIENYARLIDAPVRCGADVVSLEQDPSSARLLVKTREATIEASHVVIATGPFQRASVPAWSSEIPSRIFQVHANQYRGPDQLPPGAVLVVGSGASGCQIAEELYQGGRTVYLSVSRHRRAPRRYRGRDLTWWALERGIMDLRIDSFPRRKYPPSLVITGVNGGHDINVRQFAEDGVIVLGRLLGMAGRAFTFDDSAESVLAASDTAYRDFRAASDEHVRANGLDLPEEAEPEPLTSVLPSVATLNAADISAVVWGTGYAFDFDWVKLPVLDGRGAPVQERGVTGVPNACFLGLHWMHTFKSGVLFGVGEDAAYLADRIAGMP